MAEDIINYDLTPIQVDPKDQKIQVLEQRIQALENRLNSARVQISNLEGQFKINDVSEPADGDSYRDGSLVLSDISGTRKIHVKLGDVWYSVTVT